MGATRRGRLETLRAASRRYRPTPAEFERLVGRALSALPPEFRRRLENIAVVVESWPARSGRHGEETTLLGLYEGVPLTERHGSDHLSVPDRITIYRGPLVRMSRSRAELVSEIQATVIHEVGHYFGLGDDELR